MKGYEGALFVDLRFGVLTEWQIRLGRIALSFR